MTRILNTSEEAIDWCNKNRGKKVIDVGGDDAWIDEDGRVFGCGTMLANAFLRPPFAIPDEPGKEDLPEEVKAALDSHGWAPDGDYAGVLKSLWRATQKAIREAK